MKFVAVTACPTGIAHSQMAAENVEQTAESMGHEIKVEVQGAMGAENELTDEDIASADAVIIAADTSVQRDRFGSKPVVKGSVKDGVNDAESLIERAVEAAEEGAEGDVDVNEPDSQSESAAASEPAGNAGSDSGDGLLARIRRIFS